VHQVNEVKLYFLYAVVFLSATLQNQVASAIEDAELVFEDNFQGELADGWDWIRENPA